MNEQEVQNRAEILECVTTELMTQTATYCENMQKFLTTYPELKGIITAVFELQCLDRPIVQMVLGSKSKVQKIIKNLQEVIEK